MDTWHCPPVVEQSKVRGMNVYNRKSFKLKKRRIVNPPGMWIRKEAAFEAVVALELFSRAQEIIQARSKHYTDDEMLEQLRNLFTRYGTLSGILIDESKECRPAVHIGHDSVPWRERTRSWLYARTGFRLH